MISQKVIDTIYKQYKSRPASPDKLNIPLLFEQLPEDAGVEVDESHIILNNVEPLSPFHKIPVSHIHAILNFDRSVAIVLHSSIIFISKEDGSINVHLRELRRSLLDKILGTYSD